VNWALVKPPFTSGALSNTAWCLDDGPDEGVRSRKFPAKEDVHRRKTQGGGLKRDYLKKVVRPSRRCEMAQQAVSESHISTKMACVIFSVSKTCYRYDAKSNTEKVLIANCVICLMDTNRSWGFGLRYVCICNVKNDTWTHKRIYRIYRELELNLRIKARKRLVRDKPDAFVVLLGINQV